MVWDVASLSSNGFDYFDRKSCRRFKRSWKGAQTSNGPLSQILRYLHFANWAFSSKLPKGSAGARASMEGSTFLVFKKKTSRAILKASWNCIKSRSCHTLAWVDIELVIASRQNQCSAPLQFSTCCLCSNSSPQTLFYYWNVSFTLLEIVLNASAPPKFS